MYLLKSVSEIPTDCYTHLRNFASVTKEMPQFAENENGSTSSGY